jgi:hypothetical protein
MQLSHLMSSEVTMFLTVEAFCVPPRSLSHRRHGTFSPRLDLLPAGRRTATRCEVFGEIRRLAPFNSIKYFAKITF